MEKNKQRIIELIDEKKEMFIDASDRIWETPETRFELKESVKPFYEILEKEGFQIDKGVADMEYAFVATYGSGKPVIGFLAEYDALADLSQVADSPQKEALVTGANGHGCGHNLLGTGALAAAVGIKSFMEETGMEGTIKLFGCPAEESGYGKSFMARAGLFNDVDLALTWHPMDQSQSWTFKTISAYQLYYEFKGTSAHAASTPELGRSALDAAEIMNIGVQFLREHMLERERIHYSFIDAGGESANVVQPNAKLYYIIRSPKMEQVVELQKRVNKIAEGAAWMTETELEITFDSATHDYIPNMVATNIIEENLLKYGSLNVTEEDLEYMQRYTDTISDDVRLSMIERAKIDDPSISEEEAIRLGTLPICEQIKPMENTEGLIGSSDVGEVSHVCPTAQVGIGCEPQGTSPHSWQWVANGKSKVAHKGLLAAGKVLATTALDFLNNPELLKQAKEEHNKAVGYKEFKSEIPEDVLPKQ